ncbi:hypothetical protein PybrP1_004084 [[Pythium] brassicae (nom. inval.)]|nr:hypothetical protein PybrP1_004084 [[Pythium] brassicae (nom. inval.)]
MRARDALVLPPPQVTEEATEEQPLPPCHRSIRAPYTVLFLLLATGVLPALTLAAVESSRGHLLLFAGELLLAAASLEWAWLSFRVRQKLLFTLRVAATPSDAAAPESEACLEVQHNNHEPESARSLGTPTAAELFRQRQRAMRPAQCAVSEIAARRCGGRWYIPAAVAASLGAATILALVYLLERAVFESDKRAIGWQMLVAVTVVGVFGALFLGCLAPSKLDAFVILVYVSCYVASSMNTFLMFYARSIGELELIDPLFALLVGACVVVVARIITSKFVMESLLLLLFDLLGLLLLAAPMLTAADFVDHPGAEQHRDKLALFTVVVLASEAGYWLTKRLGARHSQRLSVLPLCRRSHDEQTPSPLKTEVAARSELEALAGAVVLGALMLPLSLVWVAPDALRWPEALVLVLALVLGQWSRVFLANLKRLAEVSSTGFYLPADSHIGGVLDRLAVFLVAVVVYHPYVKHIYYK